MVWVLLAILGVPIWMIVGALVATIWQRVQIQKQPGVFACKARVREGRHVDLDVKWPAMSYRGQWVHNVLILRRGIAFARVSPIGVRFAHHGVAPVHEVKGLGDHPVSMQATLDDGSVIEIAASAHHGTLLAGPFIAAVVTSA